MTTDVATDKEATPHSGVQVKLGATPLGWLTVIELPQNSGSLGPLSQLETRSTASRVVADSPSTEFKRM